MRIIRSLGCVYARSAARYVREIGRRQERLFLFVWDVEGWDRVAW